MFFMSPVVTSDVASGNIKCNRWTHSGFVSDLAAMTEAKKARKPAKLRKRAGQYHHGDLREALVLAAEQQVARTGHVDLSLREVAADAGVTHAAAYRHFPNKVALLAELACRGFGKLEESLRVATPRASVQENLVEAGVSYVLFATQSPGLFRVMFHPSLKPFSEHPALLQAATQALDVLRQLVAALAGPAVPQKVLVTRVMAAWSMFHGQAMLQLEQQLVVPFGIALADAERAARAVFAVLAHALSIQQ